MRAVNRTVDVKANGPRGVCAAASLALTAVVLFLTLLSVLVASGCSDKSRRMGEGETLRYKRELALAHRTEISPAQAEKLLYFPGRTKGEIDAYLDTLCAEYAEEQRAAGSDLEGASKKSGSGGPSTPGGAGTAPPQGKP